MGGDGNVLLFAAGVGKPQVNELHVVFFDRFEYVGFRHFALLSWIIECEGFSVSHSFSRNHAQRKIPIKRLITDA
jgi:hypothetical protein